MNLALARRVPDSVRFWLQVDTGGTGCWLWRGEINPSGYGRFYAQRRGHLAHRYSYEFLKGHITAETLDHLCRNRTCVRPDHLEPCSRPENARRSPVWNGRRTHCRKGHSLADAYVYRQNGYLTRWCRECRKTIQRRYERKRDGH